MELESNLVLGALKKKSVVRRSYDFVCKTDNYLYLCNWIMVCCCIFCNILLSEISDDVAYQIYDYDNDDYDDDDEDMMRVLLGD